MCKHQEFRASKSSLFIGNVLHVIAQLATSNWLSGLVRYSTVERMLPKLGSIPKT